MIKVPAVIERCAGIDIGKREIAAAVITGPADQDGEVKTKAFQTTVPALEQLREWLIQEGCSSVAMESTGSYWIPVKNISGRQCPDCAGLSPKPQTETGRQNGFSRRT
jgi:transposase